MTLPLPNAAGTAADDGELRPGVRRRRPRPKAKASAAASRETGESAPDDSAAPGREEDHRSSDGPEDAGTQIDSYDASAESRDADDEGAAPATQEERAEASVGDLGDESDIETSEAEEGFDSTMLTSEAGAGFDKRPGSSNESAAEARDVTAQRLDSEEPAATAAPSNDDVVELYGQRLKRVSPRQMRLQQRKAAPPPPLEIPEPPVNDGGGDLPDEEEDEERREGVTIGDIEPADGEDFPDTAGRGPPRNLADICATYPIGNGLHSVRIERKRPEMYMQIPCAGVLGEIDRPITEREFRNSFGGGTYELIVYGPDPRGKHDPITGQPIIKALTKPIQLRVPGNPSPETLTGADFLSPPGKRSPMFPSQFDPAGRRLPTSADAAMHRDSVALAQSLLREERQEKAELRREIAQGNTSGVKPVIDAVRETAAQGTEILRNELKHTRELAEKELARKDDEVRELRRELEALRNKPTEAQGAWHALSTVAQSLAPGRSSGEELQRIHDSHNNELRRLEDQHRRELQDARASFDDRLKLLQEQVDKERQRARDEVRDVTDRLERREKDQRDVFEQRIKDQRESFESRARDSEERHRAELDRVRGEHERELRALAQQHELVRTTEKQAQEGRMAQLKDRIDILKEEVERWKNEAAKNGDWAEQMAEFERKAEAAGYQKVDANAPQTWQDRVAQAFGDALRNADKIAAAVGKSISDRKDAAVAQAQIVQAHQAAQARTPMPGQALPPGPQQAAAPPPAPQQRVIRGPGGRPVAATRTVWATEEMPMGPPPGAQGRPVVPPDAEQHVAPVTVTQPVREEPQPPPPAPVAPPPAQAAPPPAEQQQQQQQQQQAMPIDPQALDQFRMWAESEIDAKRDPVEFGRAFVERIGIHQAWEVVSHLKIDALFDALASTPAMHASPILRRDGQMFMRKAWGEAERLCRKALGLPEAE